MRASKLLAILGAVHALGGGRYFSQVMQDFAERADMQDISDKEILKVSEEIAEQNEKAYEVLGDASDL